MDSLLAIGLGVGIRVLVAFTNYNSIAFAGSLIGLWEGVVLYHFLNKWPDSYDPYIAYAARIIFDIAFTDSVFRFVLILLWTGLGFILSDISPVIWRDYGLKNAWEDIRRDFSHFRRTFTRTFTRLFTRLYRSKPRSRHHHTSTTTTTISTPVTTTSSNANSSRVRFRHYAPPMNPTPVASTSTSTSTSRSSSTILTNTTTTVLPIPAPRSQNRILSKRIFPGAFPDDISEASTVPSSLPARIPLPPSDRSDSMSSLSTERAPRTERTSDWATEVSARSSVPPLRELREIPDVTPPPPPPPPPVVEPEEVIRFPEPVVDVYEPQPSLDDTPAIPDGATDAWETIDDDTRASTVHRQESLPPYEEEESQVVAPSEAEKPLPPPPKVDTKKNLRRAISLRNKIALLQKRIKAAESERAQAKANNKSALALRKKVEIHELKQEVEKLRKRDRERTFSLFNEGGLSDRINLSQLDDEASVEEVERAIEYFITESFPPDASGPSTSVDTLLSVHTLYATVDSESKKQAIIQAMSEHGIQVDADDSTNILIITLPRA